MEAAGGTAPAGRGWPGELNPAVKILQAHQFRGADFADGAGLRGAEKFGNFGFAPDPESIGCVDCRKPAPPANPGEAVKVRKSHLIEKFSIKDFNCPLDKSKEK
jgi:hypothetical protein